MKMTTQDFKALAAQVRPFDTAEVRGWYRARDPRIPRIDQVRDINMRYRWDLFYAARGYQALEGTYHDSHIDTALRQIVPLLEGGD